MGVRHSAVSDELVYFAHRRGNGVARVYSGDTKLLRIYRNAPLWREVSRETYLQHRFRLCLV